MSGTRHGPSGLRDRQRRDEGKRRNPGWAKKAGTKSGRAKKTAHDRKERSHGW